MFSAAGAGKGWSPPLLETFHEFIFGKPPRGKRAAGLFFTFFKFNLQWTGFQFQTSQAAQNAFG